MLSGNESIAANPSTHAPMHDVQDIRATVFTPRLARIACATDWWNAGNTWLEVGIRYADLDRDRAIQQRR